MAKATLTIEGFAAKDPETRSVTGHTITEVSIPVTPQKKNQQGEWEDTGTTVWYKVPFWDEHGESIGELVRKGTLVTVTGIPKLDLYVKDGNAAGSIVLDFATLAVVARKPKRGDRPAPAEEPWAASAPDAPAGDVWNTPGSYNDETPF